MTVPDSILKDLNRRFDHAALTSEVDEATVRQLCDDALAYNLYSVVVNPAWVTTAAEQLQGQTVRIVSVAGFPLGAHRTDIKAAEALEAVQDGAHEIDLVANIGWLISDRFLDVEAEIRKVRRQLPSEVVLKVIVEAGKLTRSQQIEAATAVVNAGAQFVKTSTGFFGGATVEQVRTLAEAVRGQIEVKASGGIKSVEDCRALLEAGATRLGASASVAIMRQYKQLYGAATP